MERKDRQRALQQRGQPFSSRLAKRSGSSQPDRHRGVSEIASRASEALPRQVTCSSPGDAGRFRPET